MPFYFPQLSEDQYLNQINRGDTTQREQIRYAGENAAQNERDLGKMWGETFRQMPEQYQQGERHRSSMDSAQQARDINAAEENRNVGRFGEQGKTWAEAAKERERNARRYESEKHQMDSGDARLNMEDAYLNANADQDMLKNLGTQQPLSNYQARMRRTDVSGDLGLQGQRAGLKSQALAQQSMSQGMGFASENQGYTRHERALAEADRELQNIVDSTMPGSPEQAKLKQDWDAKYASLLKGAAAPASSAAIAKNTAARQSAISQNESIARATDPVGYKKMMDALDNLGKSEELTQQAKIYDSSNNPWDSKRQDAQHRMETLLREMGHDEKARTLHTWGGMPGFSAESYAKDVAAETADRAKTTYRSVNPNITNTRDVQSGYMTYLAPTGEKNRSTIDPISGQNIITTMIPGMTPGRNSGPGGGSMTNAAFVGGNPDAANGGRPNIIPASYDQQPQPQGPPAPGTTAFERLREHTRAEESEANRPTGRRSGAPSPTNAGSSYYRQKG